jgi:hypothetical protein
MNDLEVFDRGMRDAALEVEDVGLVHNVPNGRLVFEFQDPVQGLSLNLF